METTTEYHDDDPWDGLDEEFLPPEPPPEPDTEPVDLLPLPPAPEESEPASGLNPDGRAEIGFATNKDADILHDSVVFAQALEACGIELYFDRRKNSTVWVFPDVGRVDHSKRHEAHAQTLIANTCGGWESYGNKEKPKKRWRKLRYGIHNLQVRIGHYVVVHERDLFAEYLLSRPKWDGTERIDTLLMEAFGCDDTPENRWASGYLFLGVIARTFKPGCKLDVTPVLIGDQGAGKSTILSHIFPKDERADWFSDGVTLSAGDKEFVEATNGRALCEIAEMVGSTRAEQEKMKALLTRQNDGHVRTAYGYQAEKRLRMFTTWGTSNSQQPLPNDDSGNRRFLAITCKQVWGPAGIRERLREMRDQLWAEAMERWGDGIDVYLPPELEVAQAETNERHRFDNPLFEDGVRSFLRRNSDPTFKLGDVLLDMGLVPKDGLPLDVPIKQQREVGRALALLGAMSCKKVSCSPSNRQERHWHAPEKRETNEEF